MLSLAGRSPSASIQKESRRPPASWAGFRSSGKDVRDKEPGSSFHFLERLNSAWETNHPGVPASLVHLGSSKHSLPLASISNDNAGSNQSMCLGWDHFGLREGL